MDYATLIGSIGVILLLTAFFLNLFKFLVPESGLYIMLNIIGAGLSCYASILIHFIPFAILEAAWSLIALVSLFKKVLSRN